MLKLSLEKTLKLKGTGKLTRREERREDHKVCLIKGRGAGRRRGCAYFVVEGGGGVWSAGAVVWL
jgi:hypothetical protein